MFVPMTAFTTVINLLAGRLTNRYGHRFPMILGMLIQAADLLALLAVGRHTATPVILLLLVPLGIGGGLAVPPLTSAMLEAVDAERAAWPPASSTRPARSAVRSAWRCSVR